MRGRSRGTASWLVIAGVVASLANSAPLLGVESYICDCATGADTDCVAGSDGATGTLAAPWQSYEQARTHFASLAAGDAVRFCRGGAWSINANTRWVNSSCEANNPCIVGDYIPLWASGNEDRPILQRIDSRHGFALEDGGNAEHEEGYRFENLDIRGTGDGSGSGFFIYNDIDDVVIHNVSIRDFGIGVHLGGSNPCNGADPECDGQNERITLSQSTILDNEHQGWLGGSSGSEILDTYFEGNGTTAVFDHNIYLSGSAGQTTVGMRVVGNRLYQSALDGGGSCAAVSLVVHGEHDDLLIEGNEIWEDIGLAGGGCWGIAVDNGYGSPEAFTDVVIRGNLVRNVGNTSIGVGACARCTIENNVIIHEQNFGITAIAAPDRSLGAGDLPQDDITVRNNSIYINNNSSGSGISVRDMGDDHVITSNAIHYTGTSNSFNCLRADLGAAAYTDVDNNLCFHPNAPGAEWSDTYGDLAAWQGATGFGGDSAEADPGFANPTLGSLWATDENAAMVDAGHLTLSSPVEFRGIARDAQPDVGAYEWSVMEIFVDGFESGDTSAWSSTLP